MTDQAQLEQIFQLQKRAASPDRVAGYEERLDRLNRIEQLSREHMNEIIDALEADFGCRGRDWIFIADVYPQLSHAAHVKKHLKRWMKPERHSSGLLRLTGQRTYVVYEPLGVVGVISPFNAPVSLAFDPAIEAIAAGNRVMMKLSESTPNTAALIRGLVEQYFDPSEMAVVEGGVEVSQAFAALPFDLLFFTGGSEVGRKILGAAAENLSPVVLELGGKTPCIVLDDADIEFAAERIAHVRVLNAGQICIAGDYALVPEKHLERFIDAAVAKVSATYPTIIENPEYTSIINDQAYERIVGHIDEARAAGSRIITVNPGNEALPDPATRKIPLTIVVEPDAGLAASSSEMFGPVLSVFAYRDLEEAIAAVNSRPKPLALYLFGKDRRSIHRVVSRTSSGGVTVNDLMMHANSQSMGFGGVGYSGMGRYKGGFTGYKTFSNAKSVHHQGMMRRFTGKFFPPFSNDRTRNILRSQVGVKDR